MMEDQIFMHSLAWLTPRLAAWEAAMVPRLPQAEAEEEVVAALLVEGDDVDVEEAKGRPKAAPAPPPAMLAYCMLYKAGK